MKEQFDKIDGRLNSINSVCQENKIEKDETAIKQTP